nr:MAG TPA: hypothetical protein [Caudoviricetes sp.]
MLNNYYMAPCSGRAKGARKTHFSRLSKISCFYHAIICGNRACALQRKGIHRQLARVE